MSSSVKVFGRIRKLLEALDAGSVGDIEQQLTLTQQLELLVAASAAPYQEIVRTGRSFFTNTTSAIAAVVAIPTTAHLLSLYNNQPDGGRSLVIDWLAASNVVSTGVACQAQIIALLGQIREDAPTDAALAIKKLNGMGTGADTTTRSLLNGTALPATTGLAAYWFPIGPSAGKPGSATTPGYGLYHEVNGRIIVPPGRYFSIHVLANVVGETFQGFIGWSEKQLSLG